MTSGRVESLREHNDVSDLVCSSHTLHVHCAIFYRVRLLHSGGRSSGREGKRSETVHSQRSSRHHSGFDSTVRATVWDAMCPEGIHDDTVAVADVQEVSEQLEGVHCAGKRRGRISEILEEALGEAPRAQGQIPHTPFERTGHLERARAASQYGHASSEAAPKRVAISLVVNSEIMHGLKIATSSSSSTSRWPQESVASVAYALFSRCEARTEDV